MKPNRDIYLNRSRCYVSLGMSKEAIQDAEDAIEMEKDPFPRAYYFKGEAYFVSGQFEKALINYYQAYAKRPDIKDFKLGIQKA